MFKLEIGTDNAAFERDLDGGRSHVAHILRTVADDLEAGAGHEEYGVVADTNGNSIGHYALTATDSHLTSILPDRYT